MVYDSNNNSSGGSGHDASSGVGRASSGPGASPGLGAGPGASPGFIVSWHEHNPCPDDRLLHRKLLLGRITEALRDDLSTLMVGVPYREACNQAGLSINLR